MLKQSNVNQVECVGQKANSARALLFVAIALAGVVGPSASADELEFVWARSFGGTNFDNGLGAAVYPSGDAVIVGYFRDTVDFDPTTGVDERTSNGHFDVFVTKLGADGSYQWTATFGSTSQDQGNAVALDDAGNIFSSGNFVLPLISIRPPAKTFTPPSMTAQTFS